VWGFLKSIFYRGVKIKQFDPMSFEMDNLMHKFKPRKSKGTGRGV
jgi:hypothetical protein